MKDELLVTRIEKEVELAKVFAYLRAGVRGKQFTLAEELVEPLLKEMEAWATDNGVRLHVALQHPDGIKVLVLGAGGMVAGAAVGFLLTGNAVGALAGGLFGAAAGIAVSHVDVRLTYTGIGTGVVVALPAQ